MRKCGTGGGKPSVSRQDGSINTSADGRQICTAPRSGSKISAAGISSTMNLIVPLSWSTTTIAPTAIRRGPMSGPAPVMMTVPGAAKCSLPMSLTRLQGAHASTCHCDPPTSSAPGVKFQFVGRWRLLQVVPEQRGGALARRGTSKAELRACEPQGKSRYRPAETLTEGRRQHSQSPLERFMSLYKRQHLDPPV
jgi:hypothetical protein